MPQSPNYERLRELAELAHADQPDHAIYGQIQESLQTLEQTINGIRRNPGFVGEIRDSINTYLNERISVIQECTHHAEYLHDQYTQARELISQANTHFGELITHLNTPAETRALQELHVVDFNGEVHMSQLEHNRELARQRNEEREKAALAILNETNEAFNDLLPSLPAITDPPGDTESSAQGDGANSTGSRSHAPSDRSGGPGSNHGIPRSALPSSALVRPLPDGDAPLRGSVVGGTGLSPTDPPVRWVPGPGGSIRPDPTPVIENPQWPRDALTHPINARLTPQGPIGGYLPPGIHIDDPRWRDDYYNPALGGPKPNTPPNAAIINGSLTTGAAAAAARGLSSIPGPGTGSGLPGHPVGVLPPGTAPTHGGTLRPAGSPAPSNTAGAAGMRGAVPGAWHAPHAGKDDDKDKRNPRSLVGYDVTRLEPDPEPVDPSHFAAGDVTTLTPPPPDPDKDDSW